jgi:GTP cyclohydrolase III
MKPDIIDRLRAYAEVCDITGAYTEANCAYDAIEEIKKLREQVSDLEVELDILENSGGYAI